MQISQSKSPNLISLSPSKHPKIKPIITSSPKTQSLPKHHHLIRKSAQNLTIDDRLLKSSPRKIHSLASKLAKSKSLIHLQFSSFLANLQHVQNAAIILKKISLIKSLKLRLCLSSTQKLQKALDLLTSSFQKSHYLTNLEIEFGFANIPNPQNIRTLSYLLQTMKNLTSFTLTRFTQTPLNRNSLHILLKSIQRLPSLSSLSLNFYKGYLDDQQVDILCSGLKSMKSLVALDLNLQTCFNLTNQGISKLMLLATKELEIKFFGLNLYTLHPVNESTFYKDLDNILKPAKKINFPENLKVSYAYRGVLQLTIFQFSLKNPKPKSFYVRFHQIDDMRVRYKEKVTRELQLNLPCLKYIKALDFCVVSYYGKESFSHELAYYIKSMESLENITFNFDAKSSEKDYSWLVKPFEELKNLSQLKNIKLEFHNFTLNEKQIQHLGSCLSKIRKLKTLSLDFWESKVPKNILEALATNIKHKDLNKFYLALDLRPETKTDILRGLERLCESLESMKKLEDLDIRIKDIGEQAMLIKRN